MEDTIKMNDLEVPPILGNLQTGTWYRCNALIFIYSCVSRAEFVVISLH